MKANNESKPEPEGIKPNIDLKERVDEIRTHITKEDEEKGLGDDSNAPNPGASEEEKPSLKSDEEKPELESEEIKPEPHAGEEPTSELKVEQGQKTNDETLDKPASKRKRALSDDNEVEDVKEEPKKRGGHQTKVVRKADVEDGKKDVSNPVF